MRFPSGEEQRGVGGGPRAEPGNEVRRELASQAHCHQAGVGGYVKVKTPAYLLSTYCIPGFTPMISFNPPDQGGSYCCLHYR